MIRALLTAAFLLFATDACATHHLLGGHGAITPPPTVPSLIPGSQPPSSGWVSNPLWTATSGDCPTSCGSPSDFGYADPVVASFTDPDGMLITAPTTITVLAYHLPTLVEQVAGIDSNISSVKVYCDGAVTPQVNSSESNNARIGVIGYNFLIDPANFSDGLHECRATGNPNTGLSLVLAGNANQTPQADGSLFFSTNNGGTLSPAPNKFYISDTGTDTGTTTAACGVGAPCRTLQKVKELCYTARGSDQSYCTICPYPNTFAGSYTFSSESFNRTGPNGWLTVDGSCAPGANGSNVTITHSTTGASVNNMRSQHVHLAHLVYDDSQGTSTGGFAGSGNTGAGFFTVFWGEGVTFLGPGRWNQNGQAIGTGWTGGFYLTETTQQRFKDGVAGIMTRNGFVDNVGEDMADNTRFIFNSTPTRMNQFTGMTGDCSTATNTITNVPAVDPDFTVGTTLINCGWGVAGFATVTAISSGPAPFTITVNKNAVSNIVGDTIDPGTHPDAIQINSGNSNPNLNSIFYGINMAAGNNGQGMFVQTKMSNWVIVNSVFNNSTSVAGYQDVQMGTNVDGKIPPGASWTDNNLIWIRSTFVGPWKLSLGLWSDFFLGHVACSGGLSPSGTPGLTFSNSPSCGP